MFYEFYLEVVIVAESKVSSDYICQLVVWNSHFIVLDWRNFQLNCKPGIIYSVYDIKICYVLKVTVKSVNITVVLHKSVRNINKKRTKTVKR